jgi:MOSC domain-containing protein YiiM
MITLGPYEFTQTDARKTVARAGSLWAAMMADRRSRACDRLGEDLAERIRVAIGAHQHHSLDELGVMAAVSLANSHLLAVVLADVWTTLREADAKLRAEGQLPPPAHGVVTQVSSSKGGVPKLAMASAEVDFKGVVGDEHQFRVHHGRPWQALCIFSDEVLELFRSEGHPIERGSVGENITVSGLPWSDVRPGVELRIGTVLALVQAYAEPCATNARWFKDGEFKRMDRSRGPVSRVYATVLEPGRVAPGDTVILEPRADELAATGATSDRA